MERPPLQGNRSSSEKAWNLLHAARPRQAVWFLKGRPRYAADGTWAFAD